MGDPNHHKDDPRFWLLFEYSEWIDTPEKRESEDSHWKLVHDFLDEELPTTRIFTHKPCPHEPELAGPTHYKQFVWSGEHLRRCVFTTDGWRMIDEA